MDLEVHPVARDAEAFGQFDVVGPGLEAGECLASEGVAEVQLPGLELVDDLVRDAIGGTDQFVVEEPLDVPRDRVPAGADHRAGLGLPVAVGVGLGIGVVLAPLTPVAAEGHRVVGPERQIDTGELALATFLLEVVGSEPA